MPKHSFYLPPEAWTEPYALPAQEARHLAQALRLNVGEKIRVLDGEGRMGIFSVAKLRKQQVTLHFESDIRVPRQPARAIMALAWSKAVRRGFFMEKAVELGVDSIWLWNADHSQGRMPAEVKESWHGQMVAGAKQCNNPWVPQVETLGGGVGQLVSQAMDTDRRILLLEHQTDIPLLSAQQAGQDGTTLYVIGPEGGFSARELAALSCGGFIAASLGNRILRCETAAMLCLGIHWWASQQTKTSSKAAPKEDI